MIEDPAADDDGLFARDDDGNPLCWDSVQGALVNGLAPDTAPSLKDRVTLPDGRTGVPVFHLLAERYLDPQYGPDAVADQTGISASTIRKGPEKEDASNGEHSKGTVIEVNVSELGLVTTSGKVVWGKYAQVTNNPELDGCINAVLLV